MASGSAATIAGLYRDVLGRAPDDGALAAMVPALDGGTITPDALRIGLATSPEARDMISAFYIGIFGRAADGPGLDLAVRAVAYGGLDLAGVRAGIAGSVEAAQAVASAYAQTLGRNVDAPGLAASLQALQGGGTLADIRAGLGASAEAAGSLTRAYEYQFGTAPAAATLAALQGELARGKPFQDTVRVDRRGFNRATLDVGYTIEAQYSTAGQATFLQIYVPTGIFALELVQSRQVPYDGSQGAAAADRIVVDLYKRASDAPVGVTFSLDGRYLGRATVQAPAPTAPYETPVDEITLIGAFGPGLHDLQITVDDPARGSVSADSASFDGNTFTVLSASTGAGGTLHLFPHPGPQPPVNFVVKYPFS